MTGFDAAARAAMRTQVSRRRDAGRLAAERGKRPRDAAPHRLAAADSAGRPPASVAVRLGLGYTRSTIVTFASPPPSHIVCRP